MKKIYALLTAVVVAGLFVNSCDKIRDFGDINKSPNSPSTAFTTYMLTQSQRYLYYFVTGSATNAYDPWQQEWNGYLAEAKNNQYGPLGTTTTWGNSTYYLTPLKNLQIIIEMNEDPEQKDLPNVTALGSTNNQIAVAKTLMAYYYMNLTDVVGPIVISEAFKGSSDDIWKPKYDTQKEVYDFLDASLNEAYSLFETSGSLNGAADVNFGGDVSKWKKFNASLRMIAAIKLSDVDPATGKSRFAKAYSDGGMTSSSDNFNHTHDDLNWCMMYYWCNPSYSGAGFGMAPNYYIVDHMKKLQDPRMFKYFDIEGYLGSRDPELFPRDSYESFYGIPFGLERNTEVTAWVPYACSINSKMIAMDATLPVITAARVLLTEAEAAQRGWISADAKTLYEAGIEASFDQWGAEGAEDYIASDGVAFNAANALEQICLQRWIAGYLSDGIQAWADWRRTDIPKMYVGPAAVSQGGTTHYPYRLAYSTSQDPDLNAEQYQEALKDLRGSGDNMNSRLWWDVADNEEGILTAEQTTPPTF